MFDFGFGFVEIGSVSPSKSSNIDN